MILASLTIFRYTINRFQTCAFVSCSTKLKPSFVMRGVPWIILTKSPATSSLFVPGPTSIFTLPGANPAAPLTMKNSMPSHCSLACVSSSAIESLFPPSVRDAGTPKERCVPEPSIAWRKLRWKPEVSEYAMRWLSSRLETRICRRSRIERACSFSERADGLNQASRSLAGNAEGMYSMAMTIDLAVAALAMTFCFGRKRRTQMWQHAPKDGEHRRRRLIQLPVRLQSQALQVFKRLDRGRLSRHGNERGVGVGNRPTSV